MDEMTKFKAKYGTRTASMLINTAAALIESGATIQPDFLDQMRTLAKDLREALENQAIY